MADIKDPMIQEQYLDEHTLNAELAALIQQNQLPPRIAQRIGQKIRDSHLRLTRDQLLRLVERIQSALRTIQHPGEPASTQTTTTGNQTPDMKRLVDEVTDLKERLQAIEHHTLEGVNGVTGRLVKTRDIHPIPTMDAEQGGLQPLETIPNDPESIVIVMKWLSYLVERISKHNLPDILGYYVDIGWISDDVRLDLLNYSKGIVAETIHPETQKETSHLPTKDHLQSLLFIQKLKGIHLDDRFLFKIDREMEKMAKSLEIYPTKPVT